jgi:hypothetical protein
LVRPPALKLFTIPVVVGVFLFLLLFGFFFGGGVAPSLYALDVYLLFMGNDVLIPSFFWSHFQLDVIVFTCLPTEQK